MPVAQIAIAGHVKRAGTNEEVSGLRVEAWRRGLSISPIGSAVTDADGSFRIAIDPTTVMMNPAGGPPPEVFFKVMSGNRTLVSTETSVVWKPGQPAAKVSIDLPGTTQEGGSRMSVKGQVRESDGRPIRGATVRALLRGLREENALGQTTTNASGHYTISYAPPASVIGGPDILVRAFDSAGEVLASSPILVGAMSDERLDLVVGNRPYRGPSEYDRVREKLVPRLEGVKLTELTEHDVAMLAGKTGVEPSNLIAITRSARLAEQTKLPVELFYGLSRERMPLDSSRLLAQDPKLLAGAIRRAIGKNIAPESVGTDIPQLVDRLRGVLIDQALKDSDLPGVARLRKLLTSVQLPAARQDALLKKYATHTGSLEDFWKQLRKEAQFGDAIVDRIQLALQLGVVTHNHAPLVEKLLASGVTSARELAKLSVSEWLTLVRSKVGNQRIGAPPEISGQKDEEREAVYAESLARIVEEGFPMAAVTHKIANGDTPDRELLTMFFNHNAEFDFHSTPVTAYLNRHADALNGVPDTERPALVARLKALQRVFRLAPSVRRYEAMQVLLAEGLDSAQTIRQMGNQAFVKSYSQALGGVERAAAIYSRASYSTALTLTLLGRHGGAFLGPPVAVLPPQGLSKGHGTAEPAPGSPADLAALFGSLDYCACEHCSSLYSPAAYLVDLLNFLAQRYTDDRSALEVFFERRPDIGGIELTCENTNTPLPYVDLVNEVMEAAVTGAAGSASGFTLELAFRDDLNAARVSSDLQSAFSEHGLPLSGGAVVEVVATGQSWRVTDTGWRFPINRDGGVLRVSVLPQTGGRAEELAVHPEHVNLAAYDELVRAVHPFDLPVDLWAEEVRAYLGQLGVPRHSFLSVFGRSSDSDVAAEVLGLTQLDWQMIAGIPLAPSKSLRELWGITATSDAAAVVALSSMPKFLQKADVGYEELRALLRTRFIQGSATVGVAFPSGSCNLAEATLQGLDQIVLGRIHRFVRLQKRLGWSAHELDQAIQILGNGVLDENLLSKLSQLRLLRDRLKVAIIELLSWWGPIDTASPDETEPSLFARVFKNRAITNPAEPDPFKLERLLDTATTDTVRNHSAAVVGALRISETVLARLIAQVLPDDRLTLNNLSRLFRVVSFARAVDLKIPEVLSLLTLSGTDPFDSGRPEKAVRLVEEVNAIRAAKFSIVELDYLLRNLENGFAGPSEQSIGLVLIEIRDGLLKIAAETEPGPDPAGELTAAKLGVVLAPEVAGRAVTLLSGTMGESEAQMDAFIDEHFVGFAPDLEAVKARVVHVDDPAYLPEPSKRFEYVLGIILAHLRRKDSRSLVIQKISTTFGTEMAVAQTLLEERLAVPGSSPRQAAIEAFLSLPNDAFDEVFAAVPGETDLPAQFHTFRQLHAVALLIGRFEIRPEELTWLFEYGPAQGLLDLSALPVRSEDGNERLYEGWARLREVIALRDRVARGRLIDLFEKAAKFNDAAFESPTVAEAARTAQEDELLRELGLRTGWDESDLRFLVHGERFDVRYPRNWKDERALSRLRDAFRILRRLGVSAEQLWRWAGERPTFNQAREVKQVFRAKHDESTWRALARPIRDSLRERQRIALVSYLVGHHGKSDASELYEHYLLDVEMSPCMVTSRIRQAISSVQLFIQRAFLNLEPAVVLTATDARDWRWMKNYRVWEANRKVFLYPENWIEPELRDDKTPFFRELETELVQDEVTDESVERALRSYLDKLDSVARLEVNGLYEDQEADVLHVFARTRSTPHIYYYRRRIEASYWTAWERVDLDIEGDHLIPIMFNRRMHLFWPIITEAAVEEAGVGGPPQRYYQIRMAWSENRDRKWLRKRVSSGQIGSTGHDLNILGDAIRKVDASITSGAGSTGSEFYFKAFEDDETGDLVIEPTRCYWWGEFLGRTIEPKYFKMPRFRLSGCDGSMALEIQEGPTGIRVPLDTHVEGQWFARLDGGAGISFPFRFPDYARGLLTRPYGDQLTLTETPTGFMIAYGHQDRPFLSQTPFFFQDLRRTFFIEPRRFVSPPIERAGTPGQFTKTGRDQWTKPELIPPDVDVLIPEVWPIPEFNLGPDSGIRGTEEVVDPGSVRLVWDPTSVQLADGGLSGVVAGSVANSMQGRFGLVAGNPVPNVADKMELLSHVSILDPEGKTILDFASSGRRSESPSRIDPRIGTSRTVSAPLAAAGSTPPSEAMALMRVINVDSARRVYQIGGMVPTTFTLTPWSGMRYRFSIFYHPFVCDIFRQLNRHGLDGVLDPAADGELPNLRRQGLKNDQFFREDYAPTQAVEGFKPTDAVKFPSDDIDFSYGGSYSSYNWELFFHVPLLIADRLSKNQRFEEAQKWFHYIFDPTESTHSTKSTKELPWPRRCWKLRPFFETFPGEDQEAAPIHELMALLADPSSDPAIRDELLQQVEQWRRNPFMPHVIARLRVTAYQKAVVMRYIDNLIGWGDQLFSRDTMESVSEATQLYILAATILGRRPVEAEAHKRPVRTFAELRPDLDAFANVLLELEQFLPPVDGGGTDGGNDGVPIPVLYFCVPPNEELIGRWRTVADRLFKIRHCMNIEGVVRELPLFEPPIDPGLLVKAAAAGVDIQSALADLNAPLPHHRFQTLLQKANELCAEVRSLGSAVLAALEKRDAEQLAELRASQVVNVLKANRDVKDRQIAEAKEQIEALKRSRQLAETRRKHYAGLAFMNSAEKAQIRSIEAAHRYQAQSQALEMVASALGSVPEATSGGAGTHGSPVAVVHTVASKPVELAARVASLQSLTESHKAQMAAITAGHQRRAEDWDLQVRLATTEVDQVDRQIIAAQIRLAITESDLRSHELQIENAKAEEDFLRDKFSNQELYGWMVGQVSALYFQTYKLAYDLAKRAERGWQFELADSKTSFIQFGYWDSLRKGLLAGERLQYDLRRMDLAYLERGRREYELTRHFSLALLNPLALIELKHRGWCEFEFPEEMFDLDSPGHYMRRIRTVSLSLPSVVGPYVPVRCTLTLLSSTIRADSDSEDYPHERHFRDGGLKIQSIVTSTGREDTGLFETTLRDERYLPFEGAGAISRWRLELPNPDLPLFDYRSIGDAVIHLRYTAREGGNLLKNAGKANLRARIQLEAGEDHTGLMRVFSVRHEFPGQWRRFLDSGQWLQSLELPLDAGRFPFSFQQSEIEVSALDVFLDILSPDEEEEYNEGDRIELEGKTPSGESFLRVPFSPRVGLRGLLGAISVLHGEGELGSWTFTVPEESLNNVRPNDITLVALGPTVLITAVNAAEKTFAVEGDLAAHFPAGRRFRVVGSTSNDRDYTVGIGGARSEAGRTVIPTVEVLTPGPLLGTLQRVQRRLNPERVKDLGVVVHYTVRLR